MMNALDKFGPREQTREQRQALMSDRLKGRSLFAENLGQRYIEGELSIEECIELLKQYHREEQAAGWPSSPPKPLRPTDWPAAWPWYPTPFEWWKEEVYRQAVNELDKALERWPADQELTLHLLATEEAFFRNGAAHWGARPQLPPDPDTPEYDVEIALILRQNSRDEDPERAARYSQNKAEAKAILANRASQQEKAGQ